MGKLHRLTAVPELGSSISEALELAQRLSSTADWIESRATRAECGVQEDAIAVLRWSAAFLRRPVIREEDLPGAVSVVRRILNDSRFAPGSNRTGLVHRLTFAASREAVPKASAGRLRELA